MIRKSGNRFSDKIMRRYLIALADQQGLAYSILPFERAPEWLPAGSGPKTS
jgi:hypothetical protein